MSSRKCFWNKGNTRFWQFSLLSSPRIPGHFNYTLCSILKLICLKCKPNQAETSTGHLCGCKVLLQQGTGSGSSSNTKGQPASNWQQQHLLGGKLTWLMELAAQDARPVPREVSRKQGQSKGPGASAKPAEVVLTTRAATQQQKCRSEMGFQAKAQVQEETPTHTRRWSFKPGWIFLHLKSSYSGPAI